ncbi:MAG: SDR family oxidoreductase [Bdellovibrionales bacterium]
MKVVITGTSRGIGAGLVERALADKHQVLAVARHPEESSLTKLKSDLLTMVSADVTDPEAPDKIADAVQKWGRVDILINNAGIFRQGESCEDFQNSFLVNSIAPFLLTRRLLPYLKESEFPRVASITSLMGSVTDNSSGGYYAYRSSKAALNMITKSLSIDNPWLTAVVLHPGWVKTDMGGSAAPTSVEESTAGLWRIIDNLEPKQTGRFFDFRGKELPW